MGHSLPDGDGLQRFAVAGRFKAASSGHIGFTDTTLTLDGTQGTGEGEIAFTQAVPKITASLALDQLVLDSYLGKGTSGGFGVGGDGGGPRRSSSAAKGWSNEPINVSALKAADADLTVSAKSTRWDKLKIGQSKLRVAISGGKLRADLDPLTLYEGTAKGVVSVDGTAAQPAIAVSLDLSGLDAHAFLTDLADFRDLHGTAAMSLDVTASGDNQAAFASSVAGTAKIKFTNGSIRGINIPQTVRTLSVSTLTG